MAVVVKTRTYATNDTLTAAYYNDDRDEIIDGVNNVVDAQVDVGASIQESKIAFSNSGHGHTGGTDGKPITVQTTSLGVSGLTPLYLLRVNAGGTAIESISPASITVEKAYTWYIGKDLVVEANTGINPRVAQAIVINRLSAYVKTPSVGADIILDVKTTVGTTIATLTILAGANSATTTVITNPSIAEGLFLQLDVTQTGIGTAGSKLSVTLEGDV